ncbi:MAG: hypothetical protein AAF601_16045 [Pseudomonadota bacterium]
MRYALILCLLSLAPPALADSMSAAEFEAYVTGKTLFYGRNGRAYGAEIYREDRRVTWSFLDGECKDGYWYEAGDNNICFVYEDRPDPQCWSFERGPSGLIAKFENDPASTELYEANNSGEEMVCTGPKIGV